MRRNPLLLSLFVVACVAQLAVPISMIRQRELTLGTGERFKFRTAPVDPYDAFRGRYVALRLEAQSVAVPPGADFDRGQKAYASVAVEPDGFATLRDLSRKHPEDRPYVAVTVNYTYGTNATVELPFDRYYLPESQAPKAESAYWSHSGGSNRTAYVSVRILDGFAVLEELYIDDVPIKEYVTNAGNR